MNETTLHELFTQEQRKTLRALIKKGKKAKASDFLPSLREWKADLEARGALPEYIAYWMEWAINTYGKEWMLEALK